MKIPFFGSFFLSFFRTLQKGTRARRKITEVVNKQSVHDPSWPRPPTLTRTPGHRKLLTQLLQWFLQLALLLVRRVMLLVLVLAAIKESVL